MRKIHLLYLLSMLGVFFLWPVTGQAQQAPKKHVAKKKKVIKDSTAKDSTIKVDTTHLPINTDTIKPVKKPAKQKGKKQSSKKKAPVKEIIEKKDTTPIEKDTVKVTFGKNITNLKTFNGWIIDERGKWVHSPNRIPFTNPEYNNELYTKYKLGAENIRQINIYEIKIDSEPYLAIILEQYKGHYADKMDTDFRYFIGADYYLVKREDFPFLWSDTMKMKEPYAVTMKAWYSGLVGYKDVKLRAKYMTGEINKDIRNSIYTDTSVKTYLQFGLKPFQNKSGRYMRFYYGLAYAKTGSQVPPFNLNIFKDRFYESDLELFHKFTRPPGLPAPKTLKARKKSSKSKTAKPIKKEEPPKPKEENHEDHPPIED